MTAGKLAGIVLIWFASSASASSEECDPNLDMNCEAESAEVRLLQRHADSLVEREHVQLDSFGNVQEEDAEEEETERQSAEGGYVEGTPGAAWTEQEALDVYAKLLIFTANPAAQMKQAQLDKFTECYTENQISFSEMERNSESDCASSCEEQKERCSSFVYDQTAKKCTLRQPEPCSHVKNWFPHMGSDPKMPMLLRLGFHSCVPYEDGTGGCDGCVSTEDMFVRYIRRDPFLHRPAEKKGSNGNMGPALDMLQKIYEDPAFPRGSPVLKKSLKDSGKSRADLYAFAALAAANWGMTNSNNACSHNSSIYSLMNIPFECKITLSHPLTFKTGRKDCQKKEQKAWRCEASCKESSPIVRDAGCKNGFYPCKKKSFFKESFNFNKKDTVAIMGAHGIGEFHSETSGGFRYMWTHNEQNQLNNLYYRVISLSPSYHFEIGVVPGSKVNVPPTIVGGVRNEIARSRYFLHRGGEEVPHGGIFQWFHQYERCPLCKDDKIIDYKLSSWDYGGQHGNICCSLCKKATKAVTKIGSDRVVYETVEGLNDSETQEFKNHKCVQFVSTHETFLTADVGLHRALDIRDGGEPKNCAQSTGQPCPLNELQDPGEKKMHEIVEMYMDNQNMWAADFVDVMERMLENGVDGSTLTESFNFGAVGDVVCDSSSGALRCRKRNP
eukprot:TRINITY_DN20556_c0_g1_i1.p1 TRINITY_DN20556_c0_g1~~TRINITY_DN20556_c0_g1_i1.p1  ORF type:complete len:670 (+),score=113.19 TRINITY_DN20556_c0_g1_i1:50-2059(+)